MKKLALVFLISFTGFASGCATSGNQSIQKKCKSVTDLTDTFVCEQP